MTKVELMLKGKVIASEMKERILKGSTVADVTYEADGCRILVTITEDGKYGYAVYEPGKNEPTYLAESTYLIENLQKRTDTSGRQTQMAKWKEWY